MSKSILIFFIFISSTLLQENVYPSLKYIINEPQLKDLEIGIIKYFLNNKDFSFPGFNFTQKIDFIGTVQFNMSDSKFRLVDLTDKTFEINFNEPDKISLKVYNVKALIQFYYIFRSNFYSNHGTGKIAIKDTSVTMNTKVLRITNKKEPNKKGPGLEIESFSFDAKDFEFDFEHEGTLEKMIEYILLNAKNAIVEIIKNKFNTDYRPLVNKQLYNLMENSNLSFPINSNMTIHYSMNREPQIKKNFLQMEFEAQIKDKNYEYKGKTIEIPEVKESNYAIDLLLSQYIFDNLFFLLGKQNRFNLLIKSEQVPIALTAGLLSNIFPNITQKFDSLYLADIGFEVENPPSIKFIEGKAMLNLYENLTVYCRKDNVSKSEFAISGDTDIELLLYINVTQSKIDGKIDSAKMTRFKTTKSTFEQNDDESVVQKSQMIIDAMISLLNMRISEALKNISLPMIEGVELKNIDVHIHDQYMNIGILPNITKKAKKFFFF